MVVLGEQESENEVVMNRKYIVVFSFLSGLAFSNITVADNIKTIGIGAGSLYNGLGISFGNQSKDSLKYVSLGCLSVGVSDSRGTELNCGIGGGILKTGLAGSLGK